MGEVNLNDFFRKYPEEEIIEIKKFLSETLSDVNDDNMEEKADRLGKNKYLKYPEVQYYRVNLLIRLGKIGKAYNIASNSSFGPLKVIAKELKQKLEGLESKRKLHIDKIVDIFSNLYHVDKTLIVNEINKMLYEDVMDLYDLISNISSLSDEEKLKKVSNEAYNKFSIIQYIRIITLFNTDKPNNVKKAENLLKSFIDKQLFQNLIGYYEKMHTAKEVVIEEKTSTENTEVKVETPKKKETKYVTSKNVTIPTKIKVNKNKKKQSQITIEQALFDDILPIETYIYSRMYPPMVSKIILSDEFKMFHQADISKSEMTKLSIVSKKYVQDLKQVYEKQQKAIKAWDFFSELVSHSIEDKEALLKVIYIIEKFQKLGVERTEIELPVDVKTYTKYIK